MFEVTNLTNTKKGLKQEMTSFAFTLLFSCKKAVEEKVKPVILFLDLKQWNSSARGHLLKMYTQPFL